MYDVPTNPVEVAANIQPQPEFIISYGYGCYEGDDGGTSGATNFAGAVDFILQLLWPKVEGQPELPLDDVDDPPGPPDINIQIINGGRSAEIFIYTTKEWRNNNGSGSRNVLPIGISKLRRN